MRAPNVQALGPFWICPDCLLWIANGDLTGIESDKEAERIQNADSDTEGYWAPGGLCDDHESPDECEADEYACDTQEFSWSPCDRCDSRLGGSRHRASILINETTDAQCQEKEAAK